MNAGSCAAQSCITKYGNPLRVSESVKLASQLIPTWSRITGSRIAPRRSEQNWQGIIQVYLSSELRARVVAGRESPVENSGLAFPFNWGNYFDRPWAAQMLIDN
jgi:hypothetical protein